MIQSRKKSSFHSTALRIPRAMARKRHRLRP